MPRRTTFTRRYTRPGPLAALALGIPSSVACAHGLFLWATGEMPWAGLTAGLKEELVCRVAVTLVVYLMMMGTALTLGGQLLSSILAPLVGGCVLDSRLGRRPDECAAAKRVEHGPGLGSGRPAGAEHARADQLVATDRSDLPALASTGVRNPGGVGRPQRSWTHMHPGLVHSGDSFSAPRSDGIASMTASRTGNPQ